VGSARVRRPSTSKRIESQQFNWHYGSAQRRFAPTGLRNHPDWVFAVIRSKCSIYRGIDVRFTVESVFDLAGIGILYDGRKRHLLDVFKRRSQKKEPLKEEEARFPQRHGDVL